MAGNRINFEIGFTTNNAGLNQVKRELNEIRQLASNVNFSGDAIKMQEMVKAANDLEYAMKAAYDVDLNTVNIQKFNQVLRQSGTNLSQIQQGLAQAGATGQSAFLKATAGLMQFNTVAKQSNQFLDNIAKSLGNTIRWSIMSSIVNNISGMIQKSYYYIKDLDSALNDIRIVTGKSADEMSRFAEEANNAAKELAVTTKDYTEGSLIYYQQGLDDETVKTLTDITAKTSNVTGQSMGAVSEQLTAVWNGYQVANEAAQEGMQVYEEYVDKMAAVGASTASDLQELSTAMSKVASAASAMGVNFDDLNAQIATIVSVTRQAPESVGTALKTIYARLSDLKIDGVDEFGVQLGEVSGQLDAIGIHILDTNGQMRDMSDVMAEVAVKWQGWTEAQRQAAAVAMAGKRQYNNLIALFDNWDMYGEALETSMNAAGTLEQQQEIALDSLANKMDILKATAEDLYDSLYNEEDIKGLVTGLTKIVQVLADFSDSIGGLTNLLPMLGAIGLRVFSGQIAEGLNTVITNTKNVFLSTQQMKTTYEELKAMFSDSSLFASTDLEGVPSEAMNKGIQDLYNYYDRMHQYQNVISKEQKETYNNILNSIAKVGELNVQIEDGANKLRDQNEGWQLIDKDIIGNTEQAEKFYSEINKINRAAVDLSQQIHAGFEIMYQSKGETILRKAGEDAQLSSIQIEKLIAEYNKFYQANGDAEKSLQLVTEKLVEMGAKGEEIVRVTQQMKNLEAGSKKAGDALEKTLNSQQRLKNITDTIGAVGQLAFSLNTLGNIGNILKNEDLSIWDKFLQTTINLSFVLPNLIGFFTKLNSYIPLTTQAILNQVDAQELENIELIKNNALQEKEAAAEAYATLTSKGFSLAKAQETIKLIFNKSAIQAETAAEYANIAAKLQAKAIALGLIVVAALVVAGIKAAIEARKKEHEQILKTNKNTLDEIKSRQDLIKANKDLFKSFDNLYKQYKNGEDVKDDLYQTTLDLAEAYDIENAKILALADNYDLLNKKIEEKREAELKSNLKDAKKAAQAAGENALEDATGKESNTAGFKIGNKYIRQDSWNNYGNPSKAEIEAARIGGFTISSSEHDGPGVINAVEVDFSNPKAIKKYIDNTRKSIEYMDATLTETQKKKSKFYQEQKEELAELEEYSKELETQFENIYEAEVELAVKSSNLFNKDSIYDFNRELEKVRENLVNEGLVPEEEVDKYLEKFLSGFDEISDKIERINIAKQIEKQTDDSLEYILSELEKFNNAQLAVLTLYLNTTELDKGIVEWEKKHPEILKFASRSQTKQDTTTMLSSYSEETGVSQESIDTAFQNEDTVQAINNTVEGMTFDADSFGLLDAYKQATIACKAYVDVTKDLVENKDALLIELNQEKIIRTEVAYEKSEKYAQQSENYIKNVIKGNENLEESYEGVREALKAYASGEEALTAEQQGYIDSLLEQKDITEETLKMIGENFDAFDKASNAVEALGSRMEEAQNIGRNFKEILAQIKDTTHKINESLDNVQDSFKSLTSIMSDFNETGHFTADNVQALMEMEDEYVASLDIGTDSITINENAFKNNTIARIEALKVTATVQYQEELLRLETNGVSEANVDAAETTIKYKVATGDLGIEALNTAKKIHVLGDEIRAAYNLSENAAVQEAANTAQKAWENRMKSANDLINEVKKGRYNFRTAMGAQTQADKDKDKADKKSSKEKERTPKEYEKYEADRYWELNKALKAVDRTIKKLQADEKNLYGKAKVKALEKEVKLIKQQEKNYRALYAEQQREAQELRESLSAQGAQFDATTGEIKNYNAAMEAATAQYNAMVDQYNSGAIDDDALKAAKDQLDEFKKDLQRYDKLYYDEIQDTLEKIKDAIRQELSKNLEKMELRYQVALDKRQAEREWNSYITNMKKDFKKVYADLGKEMATLIKNSKTYLGNTGTIHYDTEEIKLVKKEIDKINKGRKSSMFENISQAQEKLKELESRLQEHGEELRQIYEDGWNAYLEQIEQAKEQFEELNKVMDHNKKKMELIHQIQEKTMGTKSYEARSKMNKENYDLTLKTMQINRQEYELNKQMWEQSGAAQKDKSQWNEDEWKYFNNMRDAQEAMWDSVSEAIETATTQMENSISKIYDDLENTFSNGLGFEDSDLMWEDYEKTADLFYDKVEQGYELQKLSSQITQDMNNKSIKAQEKLKKFQDTEIKALREKDKLSKYELKRAQALYDITLKEIALEEARNNKSAMKLTRNSEGNWSYQYVADEGDTNKAQQDLLDAQMNFRQLAKEQNSNVVKLIRQADSDAYNRATKLYEKYQSQYGEAFLLDKKYSDQYYSDLSKLTANYKEYRNLLMSQLSEAERDLMAGDYAVQQTLWSQLGIDYQKLTDDEIENFKKFSEATLTNFMDLYNAITGEGEGAEGGLQGIKQAAQGVYDSVEEGFNKLKDETINPNTEEIEEKILESYNLISEATKAYEAIVKEACNTAGISYDNLDKEIKDVKTDTDKAANSAKDLKEKYSKSLPAAKKQVEELRKAWESVLAQIEKVHKALEKYLNMKNKENKAISDANVENGNVAPSPSGNGSSSGNTDNSSKAEGVAAAIKWGSNYGGWGTDPGRSQKLAAKGLSREVVQGYINRNSWTRSWSSSDLSPYYYGAFKTGGYTGDWSGEDGRFAMLHQKELVLNADDTKNFLEATNTLRDLTALDNSVKNSIISSISKMMVGLAANNNLINGLTTNTQNSSNTNNTFNINAEFPNANDVTEIREAILSLPNLVDQYVSRQRI